MGIYIHYDRFCKTRLDNSITIKSNRDGKIENHDDFYSQYLVPNDKFIELRKLFYILYLKGGSAFRLLLEKMRDRFPLHGLDLDFKISNRSDYDFNCVINGFLGEEDYNSIKKVLNETFQVFMKSCMGMPSEYRDPLGNKSGATTDKTYVVESTKIARLFAKSSTFNEKLQIK